VQLEIIKLLHLGGDELAPKKETIGQALGLMDATKQRFSFWRKNQGRMKAGWFISGGKCCHLPPP
jgi:hypothetical protein